MIIGIDVSKATFDCDWRYEEKAMQEVFDYTEEGINKLLLLIPKDAHCVMEATGVYHTRLALKLHESGRQVSVVNPLVIKRFIQMHLSRVKSDKADAKKIREYGEQNELVVWTPSETEIVELQQAHSWLDDLIRDRTRLTNRQEAHKHQARPSKFVKKQMSDQKVYLEKQIKANEKYLEAVVKKSFPELYERLQTIPSIGPKTALELITITNGFQQFKDVKSLSAYVGISPTTYSSGTSVKGKGGIAKMGRGRIRQLLYLCSWTAKRSNKECKALNDRLKEAGKAPKVINIAIAHKLLRQAYAVATNATVYSERDV